MIRPLTKCERFLLRPTKLVKSRPGAMIHTDAWITYFKKGIDKCANWCYNRGTKEKRS